MDFDPLMFKCMLESFQNAKKPRQYAIVSDAWGLKLMNSRINFSAFSGIIFCFPKIEF